MDLKNKYVNGNYRNYVITTSTTGQTLFFSFSTVCKIILCTRFAVKKKKNYVHFIRVYRVTRTRSV